MDNCCRKRALGAQIILCAFALLISQAEEVKAAPPLFPFGADESDHLLARDADDISSPEVRLITPIKFFNRRYDTIYVNQNGLVSFLTDIPRFVNIQFPLDYPTIAPFYSDVDTRISGEIYYRETQVPAILDRAKEILRGLFSAAENFEPKSLFIVTWSDVGYFERKNDRLNTYQLVVASDGEDSYAMIFYDKIEWIQGTGKNPSLPDAKAQAGIVSGHGPYHTLKGSGTDQVSSLHKRSNYGEEGVWAFRISQAQATEPDLVPNEDPEGTASCAVASTSCHSKARCIDYERGFCCACGQDTYGNGETCLQKDIPQRVSGKVRGVLNGVSIDDSELFSYVIPLDGRAYTAVSKVPEKLGYDLQTVAVLGTIIGWLFSTNVRGAPNGFQFTGGNFNYTAEISFYHTGQKVTVNQHYLGLDVFSNLHVETRIHGATPVVPQNKSIEINDFQMQFTRVLPGIIRSRSSHVYVIEGTSQENPFSIEQTIEYNECPSAPPVPPELDILKMVVGRNYIVYDPAQQISRFATTTTISPKDGDDPCKENKDKCGPNSSCVAENDSYKCICNLGYQEVYNYEDEDPRATAVCVDVDECASGSSICDATADCVNTPGSYLCKCKAGFSGDGYTCNKKLSCEDVQCATNAHCVEVSEGHPECQCLPGFYGNGLFCYARAEDSGELAFSNLTPDCRQVSICDPFAECIFSPHSNSYVCSCRTGYVGTGDICMAAEETEACNIENNCHRDADCKLDETISEYVCVCRPGFIGDGLTCKRADGGLGAGEPYPEPSCLFGSMCSCPPGWDFDDLRHECNPSGVDDFTCDVDPGMCDRNANCVRTEFGYTCICNEGFSGDGRRCVAQDSCSGHSECSPFGVCAYQENELRYMCRCRDGFEGNGKECRAKEEMGCDVLRNCHDNAQCLWDSSVGRYSCVCKQGFRGDGKRCEEDLLGCNVLKNCDRNADCLYDASARSFRCICRNGFDGDGYSCRSARPCYEDSSICDPHADCRPAPGGREWKCQCQEGWQGNGMECKEATKRDGSYLLVTKGMSVIKVPTSGQGLEPLTVEPFQTAVGIDIDCPGQNVYWGDIGGRAIKTIAFNGSGKGTFLDDEIGSPEGISVDWGSKLLYWTDSTKDTVEVAHLETRQRRVLISTGLVNPRGIAVYSQRGRLFWSDWNRRQPKIEVAGLDGKNRDTLVDEGLALPNSLVVDSDADSLCWADADTHKIECIGIDGRNRRVFVTNVKYPFGLALSSEHFYWTDWTTKKIESASRVTGELGGSIAVPLGGTGKLYGLALVPSVCPAAQSYSPCGYNPCGAEKLCLPSLRGGVSCVCPIGVEEGCQDSFY